MGCKELQLKQNYPVQLKMQFALKPRVLLSLRHKRAHFSTLSSVALAHIKLISLSSIPLLRSSDNVRIPKMWLSSVEGPMSLDFPSLNFTHTHTSWWYNDDSCSFVVVRITLKLKYLRQDKYKYILTI